MDLVLHPKTQQQIDKLVQKPAQTIILAGSSGCGKASLATYLAATIMGVDQNKFTYHAYVKSLSASGKSIGIEQVRELEAFLKLKVPTKDAYNRTVLIIDSHHLTEEAQNALLKTLEEPPVGTLIIMTTENVQALLPTIRSRAQLITVVVPSKATLSDYFASTHSPKEIEQAYNISGGMPGLMKAMLGQSEHPLVDAAEQARNLLRATGYERVLLADSLSKQTELMKNTLNILQQMARISLQKADGQAASKWQGIYQASYEASEALDKNAQPKLVMANLALNL